MGCPRLGKVLDVLQPILHAFGHSHVPFDAELPLGHRDDTSEQSIQCRFVQHSLGYPHERKLRKKVRPNENHKLNALPKRIDPWFNGPTSQLVQSLPLPASPVANDDTAIPVAGS